MKTQRIIKAIAGLLIIWAGIGIISMHVFRSDQTKAIPIGAASGWVPLVSVDHKDKLNFELMGIQTALIREDSTLKVSTDSVTLQQDYCPPLWWVPFIAQPKDLGTLIKGECVRVVDIHRLTGRWTWLLVTRTSCPKASPLAGIDDSDSEIEQFLKSTMKNIFQFKEDVKEYIEEIERTAKELEEYERQLQQSSGDKGNNKL